MKNIIILIGLVLLLGGCQNSSNHTSNEDQDTITEQSEPQNERWHWSLIY